jgi:soluble lytic murein transglycosylase-like protein
MALMQRDPNAALAVQGRMEKMQDMRLERTIKEGEYVGRVLQSAKDDASYGQARAEIARVLPQYAARLPATFSAEAVKPYIDQAVAVGEKARWDLDVATALKRNVEAKLLPEMFREIGQEGTSAAPAGTGTTSNGATPPPRRQPVAAPAEYESAITDATNLYPQVKPERVKAMIAAESNFDAKAVSRAGAQGPMQLMPDTAKDMGVDDPFNVQQNVRGGTRYYAQMLAKYGGDERKALAAYNWGPANLDKVNGDVSKAPAETQAYVQKVLSGGGGGGTGTAQAPAVNPRIAELDGLIKRAEVRSQQASVLGNESWATQLNNQANRLVQERTRLQDEDRRVQERAQELPRKIQEQTALEPGRLREQRAGAEVQREAKQYEPIGIQAADELDLPASTLWKDVPKDRKPMPRPGEGERNALSGLRASVAGVNSLLTKLDDPKIAGMVGTIFTETPAAVNRLLGPWLATLPPEQRAFAATMAGEIMEIRHRLIGAGQTGIEVAALEPMMPSPADTDPATVRAKLTALREGMLRRHNAKRDDLAGLGFRVPEKLAEPVPTSGLTSAQEALLEKHTTR